MPLKNGRLTPQERVFAKTLADTGDAPYSAYKARYSAPAKQGYHKAQDPAIAAEAARIAAHRLKTEIVPLAIERHLSLLADPKTSGQTLNSAIALAYKHGLAIGTDASTKEAAEMTPEELGAAIAALTRAKEEALRPILELEAQSEPSGDIFG